MILENIHLILENIHFILENIHLILEKHIEKIIIKNRETEKTGLNNLKMKKRSQVKNETLKNNKYDVYLFAD